MFQPVIGIDLGTSKCCVGVVVEGTVKILENELSYMTTPSYVAFTDTENLIGDDAKNQVMVNLTNTVSNVKRAMGKKETIPFKVRYKNNTLPLHPEQISAMLLRKMKNIAEDYLGCKVEGAVISVPATFNDHQRQATKDAAMIAGLDVLDLINEPTAAAIAYRVNRRSKGIETIAVVDFGAGKHEISIVTLDDHHVRVIGVKGNTDIGGNYLDEVLKSHIIGKYEKDFKKIQKLDGVSSERLRSNCEQIKIKMSGLTKVQESLDCFDAENILPITMSRRQFEEMFVVPMLGSFKCCLDASLLEAKVKPNEISGVLLVGGSTRIPAFQAWLESLKIPIIKSVNTNEAVAYGASMYAALLSGDSNINKFDVHDNPKQMNEVTNIKEKMMQKFREQEIQFQTDNEKHKIQTNERANFLKLCYRYKSLIAKTQMIDPHPAFSKPVFFSSEVAGIIESINSGVIDSKSCDHQHEWLKKEIEQLNKYIDQYTKQAERTTEAKGFVIKLKQSVNDETAKTNGLLNHLKQCNPFIDQWHCKNINLLTRNFNRREM